MKITPCVAAVLLLAGVAACSNNDDNPALQAPTSAPPSTSAPATTSPATSGNPEIQAAPGTRFLPNTLTIKAGQSVHVVDTDPDVPHNFVVDGVGRSKTMEQGDTFTLKFDKAGTYRFVCTFHEARGMTGTITVTTS